jgi:hypothetical protein
MPRWVELLAAAIAAWLLVSVVGGIVVGRALGAVSRRRHRSV